MCLGGKPKPTDWHTANVCTSLEQDCTYNWLNLYPFRRPARYNPSTGCCAPLRQPHAVPHYGHSAEKFGNNKLLGIFGVSTHKYLFLFRYYFSRRFAYDTYNFYYTQFFNLRVRSEQGDGEIFDKSFLLLNQVQEILLLVTY